MPFQDPPFQSYMTSMRITYMTSTPLWPQGNSEAEAFMKPLGKAIKTAVLENRPWQQELSKFLLHDRSTPHSTTQVPPAQLLYNREIRGKLPSLPRNAKVVNRHHEEKENQLKAKEKGKSYADKRRDTKSSNIQVGDTALEKQNKRNKFSTNFAITPYTVTSVKGSKVVAENDNHKVSRNMSFFKKIPDNIDSEEEEVVDAQDKRNERNGQAEQRQIEQPGLAQRWPTRHRKPTELFGNPVTSSIIP